MKKYFYSSLAVFIFFTLFSVAQAEDFFYLRLLPKALDQNYTLTSPEGEVSLRLSPQDAQKNIIVKFMKLLDQKRIGNHFTYPDDVTPASDLYYIKFTPYTEGLFDELPTITINYEAGDRYREVYFYNKTNLRFEKMDVIRDSINRTLTFKMIPKESMFFALFDAEELVGSASWYVHPSYPDELMAASRDFARDSKIKVVNLFNNKEVVVTIKDYGPKLCANWTETEQRLMGPCKERVIDLSKNAFLELATSTGQGIIQQVKLVPID